LAIVDIQKLRDYCLNPDHPKGRNKARVFASFGIGQVDAEQLRAVLLQVARDGDTQLGVQNSYGQRCTIDFELVRGARPVKISQRMDCADRPGVAAVDDLLFIIRGEGSPVADITMFSVVELLHDLPEERLVRGEVGTVVESVAPGVYEVEFSDDHGRTYAMASLKAEQLRLVDNPVHSVGPRTT